MQMHQPPITNESLVRVERMNNTFTKYHLGNNKVLHHFTAANDLYFHDHPFAFKSTIIAGGYCEEIAVVQPNGTLQIETTFRTVGSTHIVRTDTIHRLVKLLSTDCWTIIEPGWKEKESGFYKANDQGVWHRYWHQPDWTLLVPCNAE